MGIISSEDVINEANLGKETDPLILAPHIEAAEIELRKILGSEKYSQIESYQSTLNETERRTFNEVRKGAVYLAMAYAVHPLNINTQGGGIVKVKGWDKSKSELLNSSEADEMSRYFRETAMLFLKPYVPPSFETGDDIDTDDFFMGAL